MPQLDWLSWAGRLNQASLLPFLAYLWTIGQIPDMPKKALHGWYLYIVFIAVAIPAGIYSRSQFGTSMANIDWLHGPCEALLTTANLLIVLGLRDAIRAATAGQPLADTAAATSAGSASDKDSCRGTNTLQADTTHDALGNMQYLQQLHDMYSSEHDAGEPSSVADAPAKVAASGHLKGSEAAAQEKWKILGIAEGATSVPVMVHGTLLEEVGHEVCAEAGSSTTMDTGAVSHQHVDTPLADRDPLSDMHYMQQLRSVYSSEDSATAASAPGVLAAGTGCSHQAGPMTRHIQGFGAAATHVDDGSMTGFATTDPADMPGGAGGSGPAVHAMLRHNGGLPRHSMPRRVHAVVQRSNVLLKASFLKSPARALSAVAMG